MRVRYQADLAAAETRTLAIRAKLQVLDELAAEEKQIGNTAETAPANSALIAHKPGTLPAGPTEACRFVIEKYGQERAMTSNEVVDQLRAHGYAVPPKNFMGIVMSTLKRLAANGRILKEQSNGKWVFRANPAKTNL